MNAFLTVVFLIFAGVMCYFAYGAWFKRFGERHYDALERSRSSRWMLIWARDTHVVVYKLTTTLTALYFIYVCILLIRDTLRHVG